MDDNDKQPATSPVPSSNNGPVMDIQPPKPAADNTPIPEPAAGTVIAPPPAADVTEEPDTSPDQPKEAPPETASTESPAEAPKSDTAGPSNPDPSNPMAITNTLPAVKKKGSAPTIVIIVAVVIALGLCALVISIYFKSKGDTKKTANSNTSQRATVSPEEVDQALSDTDTALSQLDDSKDFPDSELTDQTLGL